MKASRTRDKHLALFGQLIRHRHRKIWVKRSRVTPTRHHHENLELVFWGDRRCSSGRTGTSGTCEGIFGLLIRHRHPKIWVKRSQVTPTRHHHENLEVVFWGDRRCSSGRTGTSGTCESISDKHFALVCDLLRDWERKIWVKRTRVTPTRHNHDNLVSFMCRRVSMDG